MGKNALNPILCRKISKRIQYLQRRKAERQKCSIAGMQQECNVQCRNEREKK